MQREGYTEAQRQGGCVQQCILTLRRRRTSPNRSTVRRALNRQSLRPRIESSKSKAHSRALSYLVPPYRRRPSPPKPPRSFSECFRAQLKTSIARLSRPPRPPSARARHPPGRSSSARGGGATTTPQRRPTRLRSFAEPNSTGGPRNEVVAPKKTGPLHFIPHPAADARHRPGTKPPPTRPTRAPL